MENMYITRTRLRMQTNVYQRQLHRRMIKTEEKAKVVTVGWGDVLECRTNHNIQ